MATNLISTISQVLTPDLLSRIASALGLDRSLVEKASSAAVPGLLAAFASRAETRDGADSLNRVIANQKPGLLSNLTDMISGGGQAAVMDSGASALGSALGGPGANALSNAVGKFTGIGDAASRGLMGLLAPVVMGVLGEQQRSTGAGISQILASQKDNIARALPKGFSDLIGGTGTLADSTATSIQSSQRPRQWDKPAAASSSASWMLPALAIAALAGVLWYALSDRNATRTAEAPPVERTADAPAAPSENSSVATETGALKAASIDTTEAFKSLNGLKVGGVDVGAQLTNTVNGMRSTLDGIKDKSTAEKAIPALADSGNELQKVSGLVNKLSPEARKSLAGAIEGVKPAIDDMLTKALSIPGASPVIQPAVDTIRTHLNTLSTA